ncbi:MAG: hypothetical protein LBF33_01705 [Oscillospiraceae bacterium]|jgi:hypothetical protein|nr:hypothetical protein [Oscillospiraceae bacterium]
MVNFNQESLAQFCGVGKTSIFDGFDRASKISDTFDRASKLEDSFDRASKI